MGFMILADAKVNEVSSFPNCRNGSAAFYVLGDSSVDCGDNTLFYPLIHSYLSLYSCNGSNGSTLIPHLLAEKMGMQNILPFYSQNGSINGIQRGLNFGSAHATIMNHGSQSYQSVNQQLRQVFDSLQLLQLQLSEDRALSFIKSSIFYLSFGKDDFIELLLQNASGTAKQNSTDQEFAHILADQMIHVIRNLYAMNVRRIICMGILPLGCTPRVLLNQYNSTAQPHDDDDDVARGCVEEINVHVLEYNRELREQISQLHVELPDAQLLFCDIYQGLSEIINNPQQYGFEDVKSACCGLGMYGAEVGCLSKDMACDKEASHVWWDLYNPTKAVNSLLADSAWSSNPLPICRPMNIQEFFTASV
ncbi:PREDICTED: GDSL esterase/lipase At1g71250-like [Fragaria vesca subsp. vesca]|uniref:GDSL esterase/lipase At1g71250-like n=1 Tax=Fragaria vesca subsp. vesca TaxID=101020 RepID=UPI0002C35B3A|nr:PREDICTED: GDSL esterase/lipase At1g71250-like [Fragaria vesca subsp. vesca]